MFFCLFLDGHSRFQHLWLGSKHENPEALCGSNQGNRCIFFLTKHHFFQLAELHFFMTVASFCQRHLDDLCVCVFVTEQDCVV